MPSRRTYGGGSTDTGIVALDIEPVILGRRDGGDGDDGGERLVDAAAALDVSFVLMASGGADDRRVVTRLGRLCAYAAANAPGVRIVLEFLPIFAIATLQQALDVTAAVDRPEAGVVVDSLHLARSGGSPDDLRGIDPTLLPYLQLADAPASSPADLAGLRDEALHGRLSCPVTARCRCVRSSAWSLGSRCRSKSAPTS